MRTPIFHKTKVYSKMLLRKNGNRIAAVGHEGWSDNTYEYYQDRSGNWYVIDPMCGMAIVNNPKRKEAYKEVRKENIQKAFNEFKLKEEYTKMCSEWYNLLVEAGAIIENPLKG